MYFLDYGVKQSVSISVISAFDFDLATGSPLFLLFLGTRSIINGCVFCTVEQCRASLRC